MDAKDSLRKYRKKRDFKHTPEPKGLKKPLRTQPVFVIQKHDASRLHYDFRIEIEGVLKSWAVPKGPSTNPREKRLAVETEDHPLEYAHFEGIIPQGEYGAGTVLIWDTGTYRNLKEKNGEEVPLSTCYDSGHITIWLEGKKLTGGYALTRFKKENNNQWLLVKMDDKEADPLRNPVFTEPKSVVSGKTLEEISSKQ